jgi:hypothetical protein
LPKTLDGVLDVFARQPGRYDLPVKIAGSIGIRSNNTPLAVCLHLQITSLLVSLTKPKAEHDWIVVCERDARAAEPFGGIGEIFGTRDIGKSVHFARLRHVQFWQNLQARLQPAVPKDRTLVPGRKWLRGFFSIGSIQKPLERP